MAKVKQFFVSSWESVTSCCTACCGEIVVPVMDGAIRYGADQASTLLKEKILSSKLLTHEQQEILQNLSLNILSTISSFVTDSLSNYINSFDSGSESDKRIKKFLSDAVEEDLLEEFAPQLIEAFTSTDGAIKKVLPLIPFTTDSFLKAVKDSAEIEGGKIHLPFKDGFLIKDANFKSYIESAVRAAPISKEYQDALLKTDALKNLFEEAMIMHNERINNLEHKLETQVTDLIEQSNLEDGPDSSDAGDAIGTAAGALRINYNQDGDSEENVSLSFAESAGFDEVDVSEPGADATNDQSLSAGNEGQAGSNDLEVMGDNAQAEV